jgi:hypothetical protein
MTASPNFPLVSPTQPSFGGSNFDGFVVAFAASGSQVRFATYFGGNSFDEIQGLAVDNAGENLYAAGETFSDDLQITPGVVQPNYGGSGDAFVARFLLNSNATAVSQRIKIRKLGTKMRVLLAASAFFAVVITGITIIMLRRPRRVSVPVSQ